MTINLYTFHRTVPTDIFDAHSTPSLISELEKLGYLVKWHDLDGNDGFVYKNDCEVLINQGSVTILEFDDHTFKSYDFGDAPTITAKLSKSSNFRGAGIGQYNEKFWDELVKNTEIRKNITPAPYPEKYWQFGMVNYEEIKNYRESIQLDSRLYWRGSLYENMGNSPYNNIRAHVREIKHIFPEFNLNPAPTSFDQYITETATFKLVLGSGGGGGYTCGDFCFRDIELFGLGIPLLRPTYIVTPFKQLIPDHHYIAVDADVDDIFKYNNPSKLANDIVVKYKKVINDTEFLNYIALNARNWYIDVMSHPNITHNIIKSLSL